jgi:eukaryotic-like serine/threonine-protein kinase
VTVGSRVLGGRYRLGSVIGQGGMAVVYRAEDLTLGRTVAVKILRESLGTDPEFLERFRREARAAARLNHPNIIAVYDVGQDGLSNYFVMEYVEGTDLRDLIRDTGVLSPEQVVDLGCQIAAALEYAHRSGLIHRDVKSQNVLVTSDGKVKVADFGIAIMHGEGSITQAGMVIGSVHYMSPEQAEGRPTTAASDVYSLGIVLYEMATGQLPFTAESPIAIARLQLEARPPDPHLVNPRLSQPIADVILACLEKAPERRPASAALVAAALRGQRSISSGQTADLPGEFGPGGTQVVPGLGTGRQRADGTQRRPREAAPAGPPPAPGPMLQTDILMPGDRRLGQRPARPPRRGQGGGSRFWPLLLITLLLSTLGAVGAWRLAGSRQQVARATPTAAPVVVMTPLPPPPTSAPVATKPAAQPTQPPPTPAPTEPPAKPTTPPQPTASPVPPTAAPPPTQPPAKPTVPVGMSPVPNVVGKPEAEAAKLIRDARLTVKVEERRVVINPRDGLVVEQNPAGGQALEGSTVTIVVGRAGGGVQPKPAPKPGSVLVPNVEGMDEKDASKTLRDQNFRVDVRRESSPDRKGQVIDQNPGANDTVSPGSLVRITIGT